MFNKKVAAMALFVMMFGSTLAQTTSGTSSTTGGTTTGTCGTGIFTATLGKASCGGIGKDCPICG